MWNSVRQQHCLGIASTHSEHGTHSRETRTVFSVFVSLPLSTREIPGCNGFTPRIPIACSKLRIQLPYRARLIIIIFNKNYLIWQQIAVVTNSRAISSIRGLKGNWRWLRKDQYPRNCAGLQHIHAQPWTWTTLWRKSSLARVCLANTVKGVSLHGMTTLDVPPRNQIKQKSITNLQRDQFCIKKVYLNNNCTAHTKFISII